MDADDVARLRRATAKLARVLNAPATDQGLTPTQASVLGLVAVRGPIGLASLVELERVNPTMLSRVIGKLDERGLLSRIPDPDDLRAASVQATAEGHRVHERIRAARTARVSECVSRLPARQADALTRALPALEALAAHLEEARPPDGR